MVEREEDSKNVAPHPVLLSWDIANAETLSTAGTHLFARSLVPVDVDDEIIWLCVVQRGEAERVKAVCQNMYRNIRQTRAQQTHMVDHTLTIVRRQTIEASRVTGFHTPGDIISKLPMILLACHGRRGGAGLFLCLFFLLSIAGKHLSPPSCKKHFWSTHDAGADGDDWILRVRRGRGECRVQRGGEGWTGSGRGRIKCG